MLRIDRARRRVVAAGMRVSQWRWVRVCERSGGAEVPVAGWGVDVCMSVKLSSLVSELKSFEIVSRLRSSRSMR